MIYYFTALVISYAINGEPAKAHVWYDRERHCQEAMNDSLADPLYTQLHELYDDLHMTCVVSDQVSFVLKPKLRPEGEPWETKP